jgi:hypothetical protein
MKLIKILRVLLTTQIILYFLAIGILYSSSHDGIDSFAGLGALLPLGLFFVLGIFSFILVIIHFLRSERTHRQLDRGVLILSVAVVLLILSYPFILRLVTFGPGSDFRRLPEMPQAYE